MGRVIIVIITISHASSAQFIHCHLSAPHANPDFPNTKPCSAHTRQTPACLEPGIRKIPIRTCIVRPEGDEWCLCLQWPHIRSDSSCSGAPQLPSIWQELNDIMWKEPACRWLKNQ